MNWRGYIYDKRYFLLVYALVMLVVSAVMLLGANRERAAGDLIYIHIVCATVAVVYMVAGYWRKRSFYRRLAELADSGGQHPAELLPEPRGGEQALYIGVFRKLHERHVAELRSLHDERREQQDFIMSWIHEVKLPIAASRLLMENSTGKSAADVTDKLEDELNKIDSYVEQALYYSRIDSFSSDYFISEVELGGLVKACVKKYAKLFIGKGIGFKLQGGEVITRSDSKWLGFIMEQIIANAVKYTGEGGVVTVTLSEDERERRCTITDTGIGICAEDVPRVFDKGFTGQTGRLFAKSTGMGLYLAKRLAVKLGHDISLRSVEGTYTAVTIHFPRYQSYYEL